MSVGAAEPAWAGEVHGVLRRHEVTQVSYVPDAGLSALITCCRMDPAMSLVSLSTEQEGIALAAGAWLGGQRSAVLMQSSGVGNCVNMLSLWRSCGVAGLLIVTMRGQFGEANPWQLPMGQITPEVLRLCGLVTFEVDDAARIVETVEAAATMVFRGGSACAVTIGQRAIGAKAFAPADRTAADGDRP
ncbi:MAG: phosphonopyruvate decarboxylase [Acidimicrobiia bacterium]|nr:phosphonopyruvate decarboxylase [Acidimicrobiia bacterium]MDH4364209.1 phosphonopyruvate decarboxylase [Acidimicrobiia bacterium]MDH5289751.1 phosphonopyruvate decarboxylase [Acidimicrobiia bacterium]